MQAGPLALEGFSFYLSLGLHTAAFFFFKDQRECFIHHAHKDLLNKSYEFFK